MNDSTFTLLLRGAVSTFVQPAEAAEYLIKVRPRALYVAYVVTLVTLGALAAGMVSLVPEEALGSIEVPLTGEFVSARAAMLVLIGIATIGPFVVALPQAFLLLGVLKGLDAARTPFRELYRLSIWKVYSATLGFYVAYRVLEGVIGPQPQLGHYLYSGISAVYTYAVLRAVSGITPLRAGIGAGMAVSLLHIVRAIADIPVTV